MTDPERRSVRVRRSPRIGVFLLLGTVLGAVAALMAVALTPPDPDVPAAQALGFLVLLLAPVGALVGGVIAIAIDASSMRRAKTMEAERTGPARPAPIESAPAESASVESGPSEPASPREDSAGPG